MTSAVAAILSWSRHNRTVVAVSTLLLVIASLAGIQRLRFDTDVLSLLPRDGRAIPAFRSFLASFGSLDQLYIVFSAPAGQSISDYDEQIDAWIDALRKAPEVTRVDSGTVDTSQDIGWLADRQLLLFRDDALEKALKRFSGDDMKGLEMFAARYSLTRFRRSSVPAARQIARWKP